jgi:hypothetical protein
MVSKSSIPFSKKVDVYFYKPIGSKNETTSGISSSIFYVSRAAFRLPIMPPVPALFY